MRASPLIAAVVLAVVSAACAGDDYSLVTARRDLVEAGLTEREARCVVTGMQREVKDLRLGARDEPTEAERAAMRAVLERCEVTPGR